MPARVHHARMKRTCRSSFRLQRLARSGFARLFAHAMAVLLVLANFSAWAAPMAHAATQPEAHATAPGPTHHCDEAGAKTNADSKQAPHGKGCPCCVGSACACLYSCCAAPNVDLSGFVAPPTTQPLLLLDASFIDAAGERRLRPPIA